MPQADTRARIPDGYRDRLLELADRLSQGATDQREARHDRRNPGQAMIHASIDGENLMVNIADALRRLRR